jgi:hypothetical protein
MNHHGNGWIEDKILKPKIVSKSDKTSDFEVALYQVSRKDR